MHTLLPMLSIDQLLKEQKGTKRTLRPIGNVIRLIRLNGNESDPRKRMHPILEKLA